MNTRLLILWLLVSGCRQMGHSGSQKIARVGDQYLYAHDLRGLIPPKTSPQDSANITSRYVDTWVKRQLILRAAKSLEIDEEELERRLEDYRYKLIAYEYEKRIIDQKLDTLVTDEQIEAYYNNHKDNFILKTDIMRGAMLKLAKGAPKMAHIRRLIKENTGKSELLSYALSHADYYHLNDSVWVDVNDLISNTPFANELRNRVQAFRASRFFETSDEGYVYWLRVDEYKFSDQYSPRAYVSAQIKTLILNQRKNSLRSQLQQEIFAQAKENVDYEIFIK